ncbi:APC family permease [Mycobacterium aquaticum]|uniref:Amino acid transporter n=1 Tax=Mycobacterium aquaticum TaxID=1927124 RepID=A0A1W9ZYQ7_9MYCO|nr:APC family permease [Mycobacterium aquaticum]ORA22911.1 amino acid transporter [Mycobacterium aquaticum]
MTTTSASKGSPESPVPADLESGHLSRRALVSLALSSYVPAVGIAIMPLLVVSVSGITGWQSSLLATFALIFIGRAIIEFARRYVASGSLYSYVGEVFGPWARILTGAALLCGYICGSAGMAGAVGIFFGSFLSSFGLTGALEVGAQIAFFATACLIVAAITYRGLDTSIRVAVILTVLAVPLVLVITIASAFHTGLELNAQFSFSDFSFSHTLHGMALAAAALVGFESSAALASETRDPRRNVPLAIMAVPIVLGGAYPFITMLQAPGLIAASDQLAEGVSAPAALALQAGLGSSVAAATDLVLAIGTFAALVGFVSYGSRFAMTLARDGLLPAAIGRVHPRHHSPNTAISAVLIVSFLTISMQTARTGSATAAYTAVATLLVYLWVLPYALIAAGAIVLTVRAREFRPGLWFAAVLGGAAFVWCYVDGVLNPPAPPSDSLVYIAPIVIAVVSAVLAASARWAGGRTRSGEQAR